MDLTEWLPYKISNLRETFEIYFKFIKLYTFRVEYTMKEYYERKINLNLSNSKILIRQSLIGWIVCSFLWILFLWPDCPYIIHSNYVSSKIQIDGFYTIFAYTSIVIMLLEMMCYQALYAILNYDLYFNDVMQKLLRFDDRHLKPKSKRFLLIYFVYFGYLSGTVYRFFYAFLSIVYVCILLQFIHDFLRGIFTMIQMILSFILWLCFFDHVIFITGELFIVMFSFAFTCDFMLIRLKELAESPAWKTIRKGLVWNYPQQFRLKYSEIFHDITTINRTFRDFFFIVETVSKTTIVYAVILYSKQTEFNIAFVFIFSLLIIIFLVTSTLYARVSFLYTYNDILGKYSTCWNANLQFILNRQQQNRKPLRFLNQTTKYPTKLLRDRIRSNLFIQALTVNPIGFSCGRDFYITRNKSVELFFMNFIFILLFYKKFILANRLQA